MDIQSLRKLRNQDFSKIVQAAETITQGGSNKKEDDDRFWKLTPDKAGNASATIRFLTRTEGDDLPWVKIIDHGFQGKNGKWYIEKSLATIDQEDPVSQVNSELWNKGGEAGKELARKQKRRTAYYANILVVNDPANPENNNTVRIFKFGKKIMDKILDKSRPTFEDEKPVNVFDYWEGADFKLRMKKVEGFPNYDTSVFAEPAPVADDDQDILKVAKKQYRLSEFLDPSSFKSYDELKTRLIATVKDEVEEILPGYFGGSMEKVESRPAPAVKTKEATPAKVSKATDNAFDNDNDVDTDTAEYFRKLAGDD